MITVVVVGGKEGDGVAAAGSVDGGNGGGCGGW